MPAPEGTGIAAAPPDAAPQQVDRYRSISAWTLFLASTRPSVS